MIIMGCVKIKKKIKLSYHINEKSDGPYCGFIKVQLLGPRGHDRMVKTCEFDIVDTFLNPTRSFCIEKVAL